jgi:glycosyltransferase involved in cell wall biosynthesis
MPEIFKAFKPIVTEYEQVEYAEFRPAYDAFLLNQMGRNVLLYFGTSSAYRGYDTLLRLACHDPDTCFVHCGELRDDPKFKYDISFLRKELFQQGRLFETQRFIHSDSLIKYFFNSTQRIVSPHRITGSSGTILQALDAGKPVLVPDIGLLGFRLNSGQFGMTYRYEDFSDLIKQWQIFKTLPIEQYLENISNYIQRFSRGNLLNFFSNLLDNN